MHHPPATAPFAQARRDFSHGCIRVEAPVAPARVALHGMPEWADATALVKAGRVHFYNALDGLDRAQADRHQGGIAASA